MTNKKRKWTTEEDEILVQIVKDNFDNLVKGFNEASIKLNRTVYAVQTRWYQTLSNPESKHYVGSTCFIGFGEKKRYANRKVYVQGHSKQGPEKSNPSLWNKILKFLSTVK